MQKARDAYNEALAIYHQYSTMDATRLASEQAKADAAQKAAQANYDSLQEQYTTASSDKTYTDAQAAVTEQTANVKSLQASIDEYTQKLRELQTGSTPRSVDQINADINAANAELNRLLTTQTAATSAEISAQMGIPQTVIATLARPLQEAGILTTPRGTGGGFTLSRRPEDISLHEIINIAEGTTRINRCLEEDGFCSRNGAPNCPVHKFYAHIQNYLDEAFKQKTIASLLADA